MSLEKIQDKLALNQRIRRLLFVVRSISADMMIPGRDPDESAQHLTGRVGALGRAAIALVLGGMDLELLVLDELVACGAQHLPVVVAGPAVRLNAKAAELMSLAIHELATNAIKFGALSQPQSRLRVVWWFTEGPPALLHFEWAEEGVRMGTGAGRRPGFGSKLVKRIMARELHGDGDMRFLKDGVLCTIEIPTSEVLQQND
jgi:two-component system CheB/CheR fusion protein